MGSSKVTRRFRCLACGITGTQFGMGRTILFHPECRPSWRKRSMMVDPPKPPPLEAICPRCGKVISLVAGRELWLVFRRHFRWTHEGNRQCPGSGLEGDGARPVPRSVNLGAP